MLLERRNQQKDYVARMGFLEQKGYQSMHATAPHVKPTCGIRPFASLRARRLPHTHFNETMRCGYP